MPNADIGANGAVWVGLETAYGTPSDPSAAGVGVWVPILNEGLMYTEPDRYYSEQIRQETTYSEAKQSYFHAEGDIVMEVDPRYMPYFMIASRHVTTLAGGIYSTVPSKVGATYPGGTQRGLSIGIIRDAVGFLYPGCVVNNYSFSIENGVLRVTLSMLGLGEQAMADDTAVVETWAAPDIFGADAHAVFVDAAGTAPAFATADETFNGFTFGINHNGEVQNRIRRARSATYVKYGITEVSYDTELDFTSRAEYDNFVALTKRAVRLESINGGTTWAGATSGFRITAFNTVYNTYEVGLAGMADLVMARVNGRGLGITGGSAYLLECKSPTSVAP